ncbi:methyl-accepting chemotaxis citrate transducer [Salmonella bongori]|nr:methyl-accepting chemotaxis citrate transducer [Salmonella bongori]
MGQLAAGLKTMQQSLIRTVSAVRDNADSIYTGAGEISAGSSDLSSRTEQQASALEEPRQHGTINRHGTAKHR